VFELRCGEALRRFVTASPRPSGLRSADQAGRPTQLPPAQPPPTGADWWTVPDTRVES
jgi:hypothetical protein